MAVATSHCYQAAKVEVRAGLPDLLGRSGCELGQVKIVDLQIEEESCLQRDFKNQEGIVEA